MVSPDALGIMSAIIWASTPPGGRKAEWAVQDALKILKAMEPNGSHGVPMAGDAAKTEHAPMESVFNT